MNTLIVEPVRIQAFLSAHLSFLIVGHTKTRVDQMFADVTRVCSNEDYFNILYVRFHLTKLIGL